MVPEVAEKFARHMLASGVSVDTHNRKVRRLRKIFPVLKDDREGEGNEVRRLSFTQEQEDALPEVLADTRHKVMSKPELRVVYHLGMFTGQRFKDCVLLKWDRVDLNRKRIWGKHFKMGKEVTIPIVPRLLDVLVERQASRLPYAIAAGKPQFPEMRFQLLMQPSSSSSMGCPLREPSSKVMGPA